MSSTPVRLFIHGGLNKTGTTFLQTQFFPQISSTASLFIGDTFRAFRKFNLSEYRNLLISDEGLLGIPILETKKQKVQGRFQFLENLSSLNLNPSIILSIREPGAWVVSLYRQYIHMGGSLRPEKFWSPQGDGFLPRESVKMSPLVQKIIRDFPGPHFLYDFSSFQNDFAGTLKVLSEYLGDSTFDPETLQQEKSNPGISGNRLELLRKINKLVRSNVHPRKPIPLYWFQVLTGNTPRNLLQSSRKVTTGRVEERLQTWKSEVSDYYRDDYASASRLLTPIWPDSSETTSA